jgi:hypothetical protein
MGANQNTSRDETSLTEITASIKEDQDAEAKRGYGLLDDLAAAARNRANIERMRKHEGNPYSRNYEIKFELPKPQQQVITQQVKEIKQEVIKVTAPETKSPGQLLYEKHAAENQLTTPWSYLGLTIRQNYEKRARGEVIPRKSTKRTEPGPEKTVKSTEKVPAGEKENTLILPTWDQMKGENDAVKIAWFHAWEIAWAQFWRSADGK